MIKVKIYILLFVLVSTCLPLYSQVEINASELVDSVMMNDSLANYYGENGDLRKAQEYALNNVAINSMLGEYSVPYAVALLKFARFLYPDERDKDDEISTKGLSILKDSLGTKSSVFIKYLLEYAWRQFDHGQIHEACKTIKEAAEEDYDDESSLGYLYYSYGHFLKGVKEIDMSKAYDLKAISFYENKQLYDDNYYLSTLVDMSLLNISDIELSLKYLNKVEKILEKNHRKNSIDYLNVLFTFVYICRYNNHFEEALDYAIQAKEIGEKIKELDYSSYLYTFEFLSGCYSSLKQYDDAIKYAEESLNLMKESNGIGLENRLNVLDSLVAYNWYMSKYEKCKLYAKEAYLTRKSINSKDPNDGLIRNLSYILRSNYYLKKYEECESNVNEIKEILGKDYSTKYVYYYEDMNILANTYCFRGLYNKALSIYEEMEMNFKNQYGEEDAYYAFILFCEATIYLKFDNIGDYFDYSQKGLNIKKKVFGEYSKEYLKDLSLYANEYYNAGYIKQSYEMCKEAALVAKKVYGTIHPLFVVNYLSTMIFGKGEDIPELDNYDLNDLLAYLSFVKILRDICEENNDGAKDMMNIYKQFFLPALPQIMRKYNNEPLSLKILYDCILLLKDYHTEYKTILPNVIEEVTVNDQHYIYDIYNACKNYLNNQTETDKNILDSLYHRIIDLKDKLVKLSPTFANYYHKEIVAIDTLRSNMPDNSVIIDYIPLKQLSDSYSDIIVKCDNNSEYPLYISTKNLSEQIKQVYKSYNNIYYLIESDSLLSSHGVELNTSNFYADYELSISQLLNKDGHYKAAQRDSIINTDNLTLSRNEFERGVNLYNKKQFELAIDAFLVSDSLMYMAKGNESNYCGHGKHWIASCYFKMGKDSIAKQYSEYYNLTPIDMRYTILSDSILDVAASLYNKGEIETALKKYIEASEVEKKNLGRYNYWYANTLSNCADLYLELGDVEKAIEFEKEALNIRKKSPGVNHIDYYWSLKNLFSSYSTPEMVEERYKIGGLIIEYMDKNSNLLGEEKSYLPIYASIMAMISIQKKNNQEAFSYINKSVNSVGLLNKQPAAYIHIYYNAIMELKEIGRDSLSFELCKFVIPLYEKYSDKQINPNEFFEILLIAANHYYKQGDYITTSLYQEKALAEIKDKTSVAYGIALSHLAKTYSELGRIDESIILAKQAVSLCDTLSHIDGYALALGTLAHCYSIANKPKDALRYGVDVFNLLAGTKGVDDNQTLVAANNLATYYAELGYTDEAKRCLLFVFDHAGRDLNIYGETLGTAYNNLAMKWTTDSASLAYINKAYDIRKSVLGENNIYTIQSLYNKGLCLYNIGESIESIDCIRKAMDQTKNMIGENNLRYIEMMDILPIIYLRGGDLNHALEIKKEMTTLLKGIVGEDHLSYIHSLDDLSELYFLTKDTINLHSIVINESHKYRKRILSDFPSYTSLERTNLVNSMGRFFDWLFPLVCYYMRQPEICSELYNALLFRKGILLNSEIEFGRLIRESGDSVLLRRYNELLANKSLLNRQYQMPVEQRVFNVDSLKFEINGEEDYLVSASKEYGEYTKRFNVSWKDIKDKLNDDELSVEFVVFDDTCSVQNRIYYALLVNMNSESPLFVPLCNEAQIQKVLEKGGKTGELYQLIWDPIVRKSNNAKTIYFSPSGILNNIGIEYVDINEYENITDKYNLHRLSSTREIINKPNSKCKTAALYGGLDYSVDSDVLLAQNKMNDRGINSSVMYRGLSDSLSVRNSFEPLYNTKSEISEIGETLKNGDVSVSIYSETYGTEESFKELSGKGLNLIHLATHGMYIGASEAESKKKGSNLSFIQIDDSDRGVIQEDMSLTRSFLVMSGGDMLPSHKSIPDNLEDGILTATEISKLDLRELDLVVLSACQTALGDVDNEGVYGLQRGFKKAGANTILMSLDKVDDEATKILMVEFYKNLMSGKTKHQSLKNAQKYLRQVENGKYDKPEYWASFIMLDGLN
jgi:CHAT domain-containing protein/TolA-binding protein